MKTQDRIYHGAGCACTEVTKRFSEGNFLRDVDKSRDKQSDRFIFNRGEG